jgi:RNA-directed DNA polymerase
MSLATPSRYGNFRSSCIARRRMSRDTASTCSTDKICREDILSHAYAVARANKGAPGVDGQTFDVIESAGLSEWLTGIQQELRNKTYQPQPVRRVMIPKPGGGERPLGIPTIRDRVVQTRSQGRAGADFRGGFGTECLWLSTEAKRSERHSESTC